MYLDDGELTAEGKDDGHLEQDAESVSNVVVSEFLEALCAVTTLPADMTEQRPGDLECIPPPAKI